MVEYTELELRQAAQRAYDAGNMASAQRLIAAARAQRGTDTAQGVSQPVYDPNGEVAAMRPPRADAGYSEPTPPQQGNWWQENVIGQGPVDSPGERVGQVVGDMIRGGGSGFARGATGLVDLPGQAADLLMRGAGNATEAAVSGAMGSRAPDWTSQISDIVRGANPFAPNGPGTVTQGVRDLGGEPVLDFEPETMPGEFTQTVGEFMPGAMVFGGGGMAGNAMRYGVLPGLASEAAGQATEGMPIEPYARAAAAIGTGILAGRPSGQARPILPADPQDARMAETLMRNGTRPTAGQVTGSGFLRRLEGSQGEVAGQADDLTAAAMRTTGSTARRATPEALAQAADDIGRTMDDAVANMPVPGNLQLAQRADDIVAEYLEYSAQNEVIPAVGNIAERIRSAANGSTIPAETLNQWRRNIRTLLNSNHGPTRDAAFQLRNLLDDAVISELSAAGRADDVARLLVGREQYRNWLAVADAATRASAENGILSPTQLHQAVIRTQGRRNVAVGNTTPLGELSRASAAVLRPESTVQAGGVRELPSVFTGAGLGAAAGSQMTPQNPVLGGALGLLAGGGAVRGGQAAMRSRAAQNFMMDPRNQIIRALIASGPGAMTSQ
jgi:hypothetical protein